MLTTPARHPLSATVAEIRDFFRDDHVHAALIVSPGGYLEAVVERDDISGCQALDAAAAPLGRLAGRTVPPAASLAEVRPAMTATGRRRIAVTSADGRLLGLLCLKASRVGFSSDPGARRNFLTTSACGICGKASIEDICVLPHALLAADEARFAPEMLVTLPDRLRAAQRVFSRTGGLHAAGLFSADGELIVVREDVGRHNAVDKVVGWALLG